MLDQEIVNSFRAPPLQNGVSLNNTIGSPLNQNKNLGKKVEATPAYQHSKVQSLDVANIFKNIGNQQTSSVSPKAIFGANISIEKINKGIVESINKGNHKELQLIQAYQQQKWKEQITQRSN